MSTSVRARTGPAHNSIQSHTAIVYLFIIKWGIIIDGLQYQRLKSKLMVYNLKNHFLDMIIPGFVDCSKKIL